MYPPFDSDKLYRLMDEAGVSLVLANTRHNVKYLTGGYFYHFHAISMRMGRSQYLPFLGLPRGRLSEAFYVGRSEEAGQIEAEDHWVPTLAEAPRGTVTAAWEAAAAIVRLGLESATIGVELPFIPADAYLALRERLPRATFVDATAILEELRAIKAPWELAIIREAYARDAQAIQAAFRDARPGETTREIAQRVEIEMAKRGLSFTFALVCAGPGFLRAPSSAKWERGQILHIDSGGVLDDYVADICRMGCMGEPSPLANELYEACIEVQEKVRSNVRSGVPSGDIVAIGNDASKRYRFSDYARFVVHAIGMVPYEQPHMKAENARPLEEGMVLSIETDFLHPEVGHVKIEDAVAVTAAGCEGLGDTGREWQIPSMA